MSNLPKNNAYKSSIAFGAEGVTAIVEKTRPDRSFYEQQQQ
jgi:hypothetical protein